MGRRGILSCMNNVHIFLQARGGVGKSTAASLLAQYLIDAGLDVNALAFNNYTPLVCTNDIEIAKLLIKNGANPNLENDSGETPLFNVTTPEICQLLIDNGADVNKTNIHDETPLTYHSRGGDLDDNIEIIRVLFSIICLTLRLCNC